VLLLKGRSRTDGIMCCKSNFRFDAMLIKTAACYWNFARKINFLLFLALLLNLNRGSV